MSFVIAAPDMVDDGGRGLGEYRFGDQRGQCRRGSPDDAVLAAGADEVSAQIAALFGAHAQSYRALSAQAAAFHEQFVQALRGGAASYASTEAANAQPLQAVEQVCST